MITYIARNTLTGKFYIGSTKNFLIRKKQHFKRQDNPEFHRALQKYPDKFEWEIYEDDDDEPVLEQALLDMWCGKQQCYNINPNAKHPPSPKGRVVTGSTREKLRAINQRPDLVESRRQNWTGEKNPNFGKFGELHHCFGNTYHWTEEQKEGVKGEGNPFFGKEHTEEWRKKHSERMQGENNPNYKSGRRWWVNKTGEVRNCVSPPGPDWVIGRKWKEG